MSFRPSQNTAPVKKGGSQYSRNDLGEARAGAQESRVGTEILPLVRLGQPSHWLRSRGRGVLLRLLIALAPPPVRRILRTLLGRIENPELHSFGNTPHRPQWRERLDGYLDFERADRVGSWVRRESRD